jgi:hypothetical protein
LLPSGTLTILPGSYWVPGWWHASPDQASDEGAEQSFATATGVMHELAEPKIQRQFVLRDAAVRAQPGAQQRPEAFDGIDVNLAEPIAIFITRILAVSVADRLVAVAPGGQSSIDVGFIGMDQRAGRNRLGDDRLDRRLLHVAQPVQDHRSAALDQAKDWRFLLFQRAASRRTWKPATPSRPPLFTTSTGWPLCPATI